MTPLSINPDKRWMGIFCGLVSALIWGAFPVVTRLGLTHTPLDAYDITFIRYTVSGLILLPLLIRSGLMGLGWKAIALMVVGIGAPYMVVVSLGLSMAPVEQFAVVTPGSMILFSVAISTWGLGARISAQAIAGIALIIVGVGLIGYQSFASSDVSPYAYLIFLLGGLLWAVYTVSSKHFNTSPMHATSIVSVFSMILFLPVYLAGRGLQIVHAPLWDIGVQVVYQGVLVSTIALFFYSKSVQLLGSSVGATFAALVPGAAVVLATVLLGEQSSTGAIVGILIVTAGMVLTILQKQPARGAT
ncbi:MAG: DMT family transporter [Ramlibacter sp.]|nr:DMT family transporter [Ramlibacter sp.]